MSEETEEKTLTLVEFLEEENEMELTAQKVLGPSDDENCTYKLGYVPRQALYACMTCNPPESPDFKSAGICLACSYHCHEGHTLIELYTKRFFRCDCGTTKFSDKKCNLTPEKDDVNEKNLYNQNFKGVYCTCSRPYPDPDVSANTDEMLQCIVCEDWYHLSHLNNEIPIDSEDPNFSEMICEGCTDKLPFLCYYLDKTVSFNKDKKEINDETKPEVDDVSVKDVKVVDVENVSTDNKECYRKTHPKLQKTIKGATFWPSTFRSLLCVCPECVDEYKKYNVPWIADEQDTAQAYQDKGGKDGEEGENSSYVRGMKALQQLDRFQQVEAIHSYNNLKDELQNYLKDFARLKRVVREQDIREFFDELKSRKRQKLDAPSHMC